MAADPGRKLSLLGSKRQCQQSVSTLHTRTVGIGWHRKFERCRLRRGQLPPEFIYQADTACVDVLEMTVTRADLIIGFLDRWLCVFFGLELRIVPFQREQRKLLSGDDGEL